MSVFVIDDHPLMRSALSLLLRQHWPELVVHELGCWADLAPALERLGPPRLFCLDLKLPDTQGLASIRQLARKHPDVPVAVISAASANDKAQACLRAGARLYIEKSAQASAIAQALGGLLNIGSSHTAPASAPAFKLSRRQSELLHMLNQGLSNRDMAEKAGISEHTVKVHLWRLFRRLEVNSRTQALHQARQLGLLLTGSAP